MILSKYVISKREHSLVIYHIFFQLLNCALLGLENKMYEKEVGVALKFLICLWSRNCLLPA